MMDSPEILITYSQSDNDPANNGKGWVNNFKEFLEAILQQMTKSTPVIQLVSDSDEHSEELYTRVPILISLISQNFLDSKPLTKGIASFVSNKQKNLLLNGHPVFYQVFRNQTESEALPNEVQSLIRYNFFQVNPKTGRVEEYDNFFGLTAGKKFWLKLVDMAYDISKILEATNPKYSVYQEVKKGDEVIYLAETGIDLAAQRDVIRRELIRYGFKVLPAQNLPNEESLLREKIVADLEKVNLSIHLIGEDYGKIPQDMDISIVELQNQLSTEYGLKEEANKKTNGFRRLIWIAPHLTNITERQKLFVETLRSDAENLENAEIMQTSIHGLRTILRNQLIYKRRDALPNQIDETEEENEVTKIYLIVDKQDIKATEPIASLFKSKGLEVLYSDFEKDLIELRNYHQENLRKCDATIIYHGNTNEEWMKAKIQDIIKSPGFGRKKPMKVKAIILEEDKELNKDHLKRSDALVLRKGKEVSEELLKPILERLSN